MKLILLAISIFINLSQIVNGLSIMEEISYFSQKIGSYDYGKNWSLGIFYISTFNSYCTSLLYIRNGTTNLTYSSNGGYLKKMIV